MLSEAMVADDDPFRLGPGWNIPRNGITPPELDSVAAAGDDKGPVAVRLTPLGLEAIIDDSGFELLSGFMGLWLDGPGAEAGLVEVGTPEILLGKLIAENPLVALGVPDGVGPEDAVVVWGRLELEIGVDTPDDGTAAIDKPPNTRSG